jgi:hypothetical protein
MQIKDWRSHYNRHYAANDATRCLDVLSGLISTDNSITLLPAVPSKQVQLLFKLPMSWRQDSRQYGGNSFTARITTSNGSVLPSAYSTPLSVSELFTKYELKAVGLNSQTERVRLNGVRFWWISFHTLESLEDFTKEVDGLSLEGTQLRVIESTSTLS